jgi:type II secretory pathway component PulF
VADGLRARGLMPVSIKPVQKRFDLSAVTESLTRVKLLDKITFIKNLSVMIKSGLPVSRALKILVDQTTNKKFP